MPRLAPPFRESTSPVEHADLAEMSLLLPGWQLASLVKAAAAEGVTAGQFLRRLLAQALATSHREPAPLA